MYHEMWCIGKGESYLYTEDVDLARFLKAKLRRSATYERNGRIYAWQFLASTARLEELLAEHQSIRDAANLQNRVLKNKDLQARIAV